MYWQNVWTQRLGKLFAQPAVDEDWSAGASFARGRWPIAAVNEEYRPLFAATVEGNWKVAEGILYKDPKAITVEVMTIRDKPITLLEVAVMAAQDQLVEELLERLPVETDVFILRRALSTAARKGRIRMVKALVDKVNGESESVQHALVGAIFNAPMQKEVIWFLARLMRFTPDHVTLIRLIMAGHLDMHNSSNSIHMVFTLSVPNFRKAPLCCPSSTPPGLSSACGFEVDLKPRCRALLAAESSNLDLGSSFTTWRARPKFGLELHCAVELVPRFAIKLKEWG
ncbi:hypothetical protein NL676_007664 [Syzygium grande]|nr:hypothetical protein NL676_007664 [Syzygium grande]